MHSRLTWHLVFTSSLCVCFWALLAYFIIAESSGDLSQAGHTRLTVVVFVPALVFILFWASLVCYFLPGLLDPEVGADKHSLFLVCLYLTLALYECFVFLLHAQWPS